MNCLTGTWRARTALLLAAACAVQLAWAEEDGSLLSSRIMHGQVPFRKSRIAIDKRPVGVQVRKAENPDELGGFLVEPVGLAARADSASLPEPPLSGVLLPSATRAGIAYQMLAQAPGAPTMPPLPPLPGATPPVSPPIQPPETAVRSIRASTETTGATTRVVNLDEMVNLDLRDTDIKHFIKILSDQTQTNWMYDPATLSGKINMLGPQKMTLREALYLLKSVLEFKGFTIEELGQLRRVVPRPEGKWRNTILRLEPYEQPTGSPLSDDQLVTQLIRVKYRNVNEVRGILVNFAKDAAAILPYAPTNSLFITDNGTYIHRLVKIIQELDTPSRAKKLFILPLRYAFAKQIMQPLQQVLGGTAAGAQAAAGAPGVPPQEGVPPPAPNPSAAPSEKPTIMPDDADNTLLVICYEEEIEYIQKVVLQLDRDPDHLPEIKVIPLRYSDPDTVTNLVREAYKSDPGLATSIKSFNVTADKRTGSIMLTTYSPKMLERVSELIQKLDIPVVTAGAAIRVYKLEFAEAKKIAEVLGGLSSGDDEIASSVVSSGGTTGIAAQAAAMLAGVRQPGVNAPAPTSGGGAKKAAIIADEATNSLVIIATREKFNQLTTVIKELDVVRPQVLVEVLIVRINVDEGRHLGLDFNAVSTSGNKSRPFAIGSTGNLAGLFSATGVAQGLNLGILDSGTFDIGAASRGDLSQLSKIGVLINILQNNSRANILSAPKLLTADNQEAKINVGQQVRIPQGSTLNAINTITNFMTEDLGVIVQLTPRITKNDFVAMKIKTQIKNLVPGQAIAGIPVISNSDVETNVTVENRATLVLGGLIQEEERKTVRKIPLLGDIPLLGHVFRDTGTEKTKSNLLIFMSPHIIRTSTVAQTVTKRVSPVLRHVRIKDRQRGTERDSASRMLQAMNEAR